MTIVKIIILVLLCWNDAIAQEQFFIKGEIAQAKDKEILLKGFTMAGDSLLEKTRADASGKFTIAYPGSYTGAALLEIKEAKSVIVLLNQENFVVKWDDLQEFKTLSFGHSAENTAFAAGIAVAQRSERLLSGLNYLKPIYEQQLEHSKMKVRWLSDEIELQNKAFSGFVAALPANSYAHYYLKLRKLLQDMPITASSRIERMAAHENRFNSMDFTAAKLMHSGLYKELLDGYFLLMESAGAVEQVYAHTNASTDALLESVAKNPALKQDVAEYLFTLFEKRSLFPAAEHLALAMLNSEDCQIDSKHKALFEQYRKMAKGNTAPDIDFASPVNGISKLSAIKANYKLIVFGASWCTKCQEDLPQLIPFYDNWKEESGLEIVFVSLDQDKASYTPFIKDFPWISSCDFKGWESQAAVDYCVFGTPTMYLLDANDTILLKPISAGQIQAWLTGRNLK